MSPLPAKPERDREANVRGVRLKAAACNAIAVAMCIAAVSVGAYQIVRTVMIGLLLGRYVPPFDGPVGFWMHILWGASQMYCGIGAMVLSPRSVPRVGAMAVCCSLYVAVFIAMCVPMWNRPNGLLWRAVATGVMDDSLIFLWSMCVWAYWCALRARKDIQLPTK